MDGVAPGRGTSRMGALTRDINAHSQRALASRFHRAARRLAEQSPRRHSRAPGEVLNQFGQSRFTARYLFARVEDPGELAGPRRSSLASASMTASEPFISQAPSPVSTSPTDGRHTCVARHGIEVTGHDHADRVIARAYAPPRCRRRDRPPGSRWSAAPIRRDRRGRTRDDSPNRSPPARRRRRVDSRDTPWSRSMSLSAALLWRSPSLRRLMISTHGK